MKIREYCCCAVPIVNAGIYAVLTEQLVLGILAGTLAVATPHLVGAATPSFAKWIFAIICYVGAGLQVLGFLAVNQDKTILYRRYTTLHIMITSAAFSVAAVWIIISASRHSTAKSTCQTDFFANATSGATSSEADTLCNIFPWVDVGLMGGLWVVMAIAQFYFYFVVSSFGKAQREAISTYNSIYDASKPLTNDIPMNDRSDPWDPRRSVDSLDNEGGRGRGFSHHRDDSIQSVSTVMGDKMERPTDGYAPGGYPSYGGGDPSQPGRRTSVLSQPSYAYTQDPGPTPRFNDNYYSSSRAAGMDMPERAQAHPG
ncbi:hypothetical protein GLOTRDRAFT_68641 [Gloeophyllum trabeum ATCC 11539]|uniref:Uncharacterized protein n=1 Tax=Gloeophyllum trabeum (strain ATCC 11539 / FP-39264 / Madison 617) TaxID=670483 RepID=S7S4C6_GLOTA|nr:uncharacterized protein GLOTRDRAFT_68641 [Gloeophyllum trabeum ATCC 11539]EPQ60744.1 hypothetical protein GLOTRDRAFT_68641 [Gloeophyllum trabeum ATCC 11539]